MENDAVLSAYSPWAKTRQNPESEWSPKQREAASRLFPDHIADPANMLDIHGRPIFDATFTHKYEVTEKEMTDHERVAFRQYQLWKTTLKIERRDNMYAAMATSDYTNGTAAHDWLGSPFPIIEPKPTITEVMRTVRWYEHTGAFITSIGLYAQLRARPAVRYTGASVQTQRSMVPFYFGMFEFLNGYRAMDRLKGFVRNDYECERFGVLESPARLAEKARYWERYRRYKEEWMKRYDYYVYGMRPGERYTFLSPCHFPPLPIAYNKRTDWPMRKNPFVLVERPLSAIEKKQAIDYLRAKPATPHPLDLMRPENKYYGPEGPVCVRSDGTHPRGAPVGGLFT